MSEWSAVAQQSVNPNEFIIFTANPVPCQRGFVTSRDDAGVFTLSNYVPSQAFSCPCQPAPCAIYLVDFGANISIPEGGTAGEISLALSLGGVTLPASTMTVTPAATGNLFNVSRAIHIAIPCSCGCQTLAVKNISSQAINVQNANIIFGRPDLTLSR